MTITESFALGQHLTSWGEGDTYDSISEAFEKGECPDSVIIWVVYEDYPTEQIAEWIWGVERAASELIKLAKETNND